MTANTDESGLLEVAHPRRVLLLETDERVGLVASIAAACHDEGVSLEITTGLSHVLLTFEADNRTTEETVERLGHIAGVATVHPYTVMAIDPKLQQE